MWAASQCSTAADSSFKGRKNSKLCLYRCAWHIVTILSVTVIAWQFKIDLEMFNESISFSVSFTCTGCGCACSGLWETMFLIVVAELRIFGHKTLFSCTLSLHQIMCNDNCTAFLQITKSLGTTTIQVELRIWPYIGWTSNFDLVLVLFWSPATPETNNCAFSFLAV